MSSDEQAPDPAGVEEQRILAAWQANAAPWADAIQCGQIESRRTVTDDAIVAAVLERAPGAVLDVGCGEGWLVRALAGRVPVVVGVDATPSLIATARAGGLGRFEVLSYADLGAGALAGRFDVVTCNFALLGDASVEQLFAALAGLLAPDGVVIVQTLHPVMARGDLPYRDGWREGSWAGFGPAFSQPAPWYFRTLSGWQALFGRHGLTVLELREPLWPREQVPASVLFIAAVGHRPVTAPREPPRG